MEKIKLPLASWVFFCALLFALIGSLPTLANEEHEHQNAHSNSHVSADVITHDKAVTETKTPSKEVCGIIERFGGHVQVLATQLGESVEARVRLPLKCDSWVSVDDGFALIKHKNGYQLSIGSASFVQITNGDTGEDAWVLFRGQGYLKADASQGELRVSTANARMRMNGGTAYLIYRSEEGETQFTSLSQSKLKASLENKYAPERKITLKPGEFTSLNLKALRVVPSTPKAANVASLKARFHELHADEMDVKVAHENIHERQERKIASEGIPEEAKPAIEHSDEKDSKDVEDDDDTALAKKREKERKKEELKKQTAKLSKEKKKKKKPSEQRDPASEENEKARLLRELMKIQPEV